MQLACILIVTHGTLSKGFCYGMFMIKILLVEDNSHDIDLVRNALGEIADTHFDVTFINRLTAAQTYLESNRLDVLLLGVVSPDSSGLEKLAQICALAPDTPIVLLMESKDQGFFVRAIRNGVQDYLVKSQINAISLSQTLHAAVERNRSERARRDVALHESEARLRTVTDNIPALIAYVGVDQCYRFVNQFHEEWFGQSVAELTGKTMKAVLGVEDYENCRHHIEKALRGQRVTFEQCMIRNTLERFLKISYIPEYDSSKQVVGFYILGQNITESKLNEARLESIALYDPLTGLANRLLLADRVSQAIAHAQRHSTAMALIYLDLDGFKQVNDTLGHDAGDLLLREVAERLVSSLRQEDTVARLGGDEFVIAIWQAAGVDDAAKVAAKVIAAVSQPYSIRGHTLSLTASAGVSLYPGQGNDMEALLKSADLAMYEAKRGGKNAFRVFDDPQKMYA